MKRLTLVVYFVFLVFPGFSWAQNFYKLNTAGVEKHETAAIESLLNQAEMLLPPSLKTQFPQGIEVQFSLNGQSHGKALIRSKTAKIALNKKLISAIVAGEKNSPLSQDKRGEVRTHKTLYREALATVLHETAHLYDYLDLQTVEMRTRINWCANVPFDDQVMKNECAIYNKIKTTVSTNPYYQEIAGWLMTSNGNGDRTSDNMFRFRSPDTYELENPIEHFAVNFEYFLLDPEFACRRPMMAQYLSRHFQVSGQVFQAPCAVNYRYVDPDATDIDSQTKTIKNLFKEIPLERVYQVHYLQAEPGTSVMSRFGHSMLRLVICAPGKPKGPKCLTEDLGHNLVLSFRAFINTPQISSIAGLTGRYPSRLFVVPMMNVTDEYNDIEYRGLTSYPLNLSEQEIKNLVERSLETHWSYDSRYYFISNNCAVETLNLLRSALMRPELIDKRIIFPNDLLNVLKQEKLLIDIPKDRNKAIVSGFYFDSKEEQNLNSYYTFFGKKVDEKELAQFFKLPTSKRRELYFQRFAEIKNVVSEKTLMSPFSLEVYALKIAKSEFRSEVTTQLWMNHTGRAIESIKDMSLHDIYKKSVEAFGALSAPYQILKLTNYGIPNLQEMKDSESEISSVRERIQEARKMEDEIEKELQNNSSFKEILEIRKLISDILEVI